MKTLRLIASNLLVVAIFVAAVLIIRVWWGDASVNNELPGTVPEDRIMGNQSDTVGSDLLQLSITGATLMRSSEVPDDISLSYAAEQTKHSHYIIVGLKAQNLSEHAISFPYYGSEAEIQVVLGVTEPFPDLMTALHPRDAGKISSGPIFDNESIAAGEYTSGNFVFALTSRQKDYHFLIIGSEWKKNGQTINIPSFDFALTNLQTN